MQSIKEIYKIGFGPSSSHTIGPRKAAIIFLERNNHAASIQVSLFGSLALTGKGHLTDQALQEELGGYLKEIKWFPKIVKERHTNALLFESFDGNGKLIEAWEVYSVGGGALEDEHGPLEKKAEAIYADNSMHAILQKVAKNGWQLWEYVYDVEGDDLWDHLTTVWEVMQQAVQRGIEREGVLPGIIHFPRKASSYYEKSRAYKDSLKRKNLLFSYALAVSEENASGGEIVTAPTCGSCGVLPAVLYLLKTEHGFTDKKIIRALATAGLIGNLVKKNASISGAEVGCQGEIGTACAMASGAATQLFGGTPAQVEYSAEMGLEHHLGLTCDPIAGLVQVPCIERNAFAAARALDANSFAMLSDGKHSVSFDKVVKTMNQTGHDLPSLYKETSLGGLAID